MGQLTIYLDDPSLRRVKAAARRERRSVSGWVKERIVRQFDQVWPDGYFDLLGSLADEELERPTQPMFDADCKRERP